MRDDRELPCPACGFLTLVGKYGSYVICPVCGWEDDQLQLANPASGGGANSESLVEAQADALAQYPVDVVVAAGVRRDPRWRPLNEAERNRAVRERAEEHWKNKGVLDLAECYWIKATLAE